MAAILDVAEEDGGCLDGGLDEHLVGKKVGCHWKFSLGNKY